MLHYNTHSINTEKMNALESLWFLSTIMMMISSILCLALAFLALLLPGNHTLTLLMLLSTVIFAIVAWCSLRLLHRRQRKQQLS